MPPKFHTLQIADIRKETEDTVSIAFQVPDSCISDYDFYAGQYLTLRSKINGEDVRRSYSLCSAPFEKEWRVAVKQVVNGAFSTYANENLKKGDSLDVMTPTGNFCLHADPNETRSYALFAAGSGITPILSIAKTALKEEPHSDVTLFYGNKNFNSIIFREELEALKNRYMDRLRVIHVLSRESLGNNIQKGRINKEKANDLFNAFLKDTPVDAVYICGPEEMILGVKDSMITNGIDEKKVHFELFTSPGIKKTEEKRKTILDAAQRAGADLPFACKGGVCCTCKAKVIEGSAKMDVNYAIEKDEVEAGYILTCQAHPTSEKLVVSFDE